MWRVLRMYGVDETMLKGIKSFYNGSSDCLAQNAV